MKKSPIATADCGLSGSLKKSLVFRRANIGSASVRPPATASRPRTQPRASGAKPERFERFEGKRLDGRSRVADHRKRNSRSAHAASARRALFAGGSAMMLARMSRGKALLALAALCAALVSVQGAS